EVPVQGVGTRDFWVGLGLVGVFVQSFCLLLTAAGHPPSGWSGQGSAARPIASATRSALEAAARERRLGRRGQGERLVVSRGWFGGGFTGGCPPGLRVLCHAGQLREGGGAWRPALPWCSGRVMLARRHDDRWGVPAWGCGRFVL